MRKRGFRIAPAESLKGIPTSTLVAPLVAGAGGFGTYKLIKKVLRNKADEEQAAKALNTINLFPTTPVPRAPTGVKPPSPKDDVFKTQG